MQYRQQMKHRILAPGPESLSSTLSVTLSGVEFIILNNSGRYDKIEEILQKRFGFILKLFCFPELQKQGTTVELRMRNASRRWPPLLRSLYHGIFEYRRQSDSRSTRVFSCWATGTFSSHSQKFTAFTTIFLQLIANSLGVFI